MLTRLGPPRVLGALRVVHPFPSLLNAILVFGLALVAGGSPLAGAGLALGMLGIQFSIGAANDVFDEALDAASKPGKPIPSGLVSRRTASVVALVAGGGGLLVAAAFGTAVLAMAAVMLGAGLAYDVALKRGPWGWTAFAVAFPILPVYAWYGATMDLPPRWEALLAVAALSGPALQLSNGLVDLERDLLAGVTGLPGRLGRRRSLLLMALLVATIHGVAWLTLWVDHRLESATVALLAAASALAAGGLVLSATLRSEWREWGWRAQAAAICLLALGWLAAVSVG
jgi:4-hydroxybenzoate polyprenyltransferase